MKKKFFLIYILAFALANVMVTSCSDDDDNNGNTEENEARFPVDELETLQSSLVKLDSKGAFVAHVNGVPLNDADTSVVSIGVDSYEEAKEKFCTLFADTTAFNVDSTLATFSTRAGSAELFRGNGENGLVAYVEFNVDGLKYVSRINYILNSAWPENARGTSKYKFGVYYEQTAWTGKPTYLDSDFDKDEFLPYVCIRESSNGNPAILVALTDKKYHLHWRYADEWGGNMPTDKQAKEVQKIIYGNWNNCVEAFKINSSTSRLAQDREYWIYYGKDYGFWTWLYAINLYTGHLENYDVHNTGRKQYVMFRLEKYEMQ